MNTINTNPALEFYSKLLLFFGQHNLFMIPVAKELAELGKSEFVNLDVDFETLQEWHQAIIDTTDNDLEILEDIAVQCFEDLAAQMRNESARELMDKWIERALLEKDLFVHLRKSKDLGDGYATVSFVTNNIVRYRLHCTDPQKVLYAGKVHISVSRKALDPD